MITRIMDRPAYIQVTRVSTRKPISPFAAFMLLLLCTAVALVFFSFSFTASEDAKARYIERLKKEKQIVETNKMLKTELAAVTQKGYVEFAAQERLGLKRPDEKEVVVVR
ncbi:MAG: cell division protein FtsL [Syntrophorhabdales bacterium]|jgi:cell division protein FtsL